MELLLELVPPGETSTSTLAQIDRWKSATKLLSQYPLRWLTLVADYFRRVSHLERGAPEEGESRSSGEFDTSVPFSLSSLDVACTDMSILRYPHQSPSKDVESGVTRFTTRSSIRRKNSPAWICFELFKLKLKKRRPARRF